MSESHDDSDEDVFPKLHPVYILSPWQRLLTAARTGDLLQVEEALAAGADPNKCGHDGMTALMQASREGHDNVVKLLLELPTLQPNIQDREGDTALSHACCCGNYRVTELLVQRCDTDINIGDLDDVTPLHKAITNNWKDIVELLLNQPSVQVNAHNKYGFTALILAAGILP